MKDEREKNYDSIMNKESVSGIIRFLAEHENVRNVHLKLIVVNHYRLHNTMELLQKEGIIDMEYQVTPKKMYRYWLTEKGKRIAKKLDEIEDILNEE
jgi:DNA-binding HxlR family transcriptional regulator